MPLIAVARQCGANSEIRRQREGLYDQGDVVWTRSDLRWKRVRRKRYFFIILNKFRLDSFCDCVNETFVIVFMKPFVIVFIKPLNNFVSVWRRPLVGGQHSVSRMWSSAHITINLLPKAILPQGEAIRQAALLQLLLLTPPVRFFQFVGCVSLWCFTSSAPDVAANTQSKWLSQELSKSDRPELTAARVVISGGEGQTWAVVS